MDMMMAMSRETKITTITIIRHKIGITAAMSKRMWVITITTMATDQTKLECHTRQQTQILFNREILTHRETLTNKETEIKHEIIANQEITIDPQYQIAINQNLWILAMQI